jgi:hypoxanthine phosphoribosyltransferase
MRVETFSPARLADAAEKLWTGYIQRYGMPHAVIGIANGGARLAAMMRTLIPDVAQLPYLVIVAQRPETSRKKRMQATRLLCRLPYALTNSLRRVEAIYREHKVGDQPVLPLQLTVPESFRTDFSALPPSAHILVLDDAVDTGQTLQNVLLTLQTLRPDCFLRTAAITLTMRRTVKKPDLVLYEYVLCRFPWSYDYRN